RRLAWSSAGSTDDRSRQMLEDATPSQPPVPAASAPQASPDGSSPAVDIAIVGAGPAGLFPAYYAAVRGLSTAGLHPPAAPGGQGSAMHPEKVIYDVAGFPAIRGRELVANLVAQAAQYNPNYMLGIRAEKLSYAGDSRPVLSLSDGTSLTCGAVIITGGLGSF